LFPCVDDPLIANPLAELLPKSVLISYAQSGKCNERQASNYADSSASIRSDNHMINPFEIDHNTHNAGVAGSSPAIATIFPFKINTSRDFDSY